MNRRSFDIPLGWRWGDPLVLVNSNALVLDMGTDYIQLPFEIERVHGARSLHVPEKHAHYKVTWENWHRDVTTDAETVRLSTVQPGREVLLPLQTRRSQTCVQHKGLLHGVYASRQSNAPHTYCGIDVYPREEPYVPLVHPTCPECIRHKLVWHLLTVHPYVAKAEVVKQVDKEKAAERRRLRLPTAYARILDDNFLDGTPTYKTVPVRPQLPEPEPEDELVDPREQKRASAIDRSQRFEETRARIRGYRR
jgi:hypothetical protein